MATPPQLTDPLSPTQSPQNLPERVESEADIVTQVFAPTNDPPPPYPSRERRTRRTNRRQPRIQTGSQHGQIPSTDSEYDTLSSPQTLLSVHSFPVIEDGEVDPTDGAPFLPSSSSPRIEPRRIAVRPRTMSNTTSASSRSAAPSLAQTLLSLFHPDPELDPDYGSNDEEQPLLSSRDQMRPWRADSPRLHYDLCSMKGWRRYFRPLISKAYYLPLFHLLVLNFPYALVAWLYLFVFTLTGTALLMALPLGAVLCFFDILGARAFARGELALQTRFHTPLAYPPPFPPRPIFARPRELNPSEVEAGFAASGTKKYETSFYKNTHAMFTDPTSYQALFYFLVIKPAITLLLSLGLLIFVPVGFVLVVPAPAVLRAVRRLGIWQANVAVEGLYIAVR